jgi:hypothetical protein
MPLILTVKPTSPGVGDGPYPGLVRRSKLSVFDNSSAMDGKGSISNPVRIVALTATGWLRDVFHACTIIWSISASHRLRRNGCVSQLSQPTALM